MRQPRPAATTAPPTRPAAALLFALALALALALAGCSVERELRAAGYDAPSRVAGLPWPSLQPLGAFATTRPARALPDTRSLSTRLADLRRRAALLQGPVIPPAQRARLLAAIARSS